MPFKSFKLIILQNQFAPVSGLSNEVECTLAAQETTELPSIKVGGLKKKPAIWPDLYHSSAAQVRVPIIFLYLQL